MAWQSENMDPIYYSSFMVHFVLMQSKWGQTAFTIHKEPMERFHRCPGNCMARRKMDGDNCRLADDQ